MLLLLTVKKDNLNISQINLQLNVRPIIKRTRTVCSEVGLETSIRFKHDNQQIQNFNLAGKWETKIIIGHWIPCLSQSAYNQTSI